MTDLRTAIETADLRTLRILLTAKPSLANQHVIWGQDNEIRTHPLHFVSDKLFDGTLDRSREAEIAVPLIETLIAAGSDVNHFSPGEAPDEPKCETPLNGAASLGAQDIGIRLITAGARTDAINLLGETSLHWAAALGLDRLVNHIIQVETPRRVSLHVTDSNWNSTPLGWAMHGWFDPPPGSAGRYRDVVLALVRAGAIVESEWLKSPQIRADPEKLDALRGGR